MSSSLATQPHIAFLSQTYPHMFLKKRNALCFVCSVALPFPAKSFIASSHVDIALLATTFHTLRPPSLVLLSTNLSPKLPHTYTAGHFLSSNTCKAHTLTSPSSSLFPTLPPLTKSPKPLSTPYINPHLITPSPRLIFLILKLPTIFTSWKNSSPLHHKQTHHNSSANSFPSSPPPSTNSSHESSTLT